jgi:hypothetical protein
MTNKFLLPHLLVLLLLPLFALAQTGRLEKDLSDENWILWLDHGAVWSNDEIFLPPVDVSSLPVNSPTCGWDNLHNQVSGIKVSVPGTVEEHFWGRIGGVSRTQMVIYVGVSWWSKEFNIDESMRDKRITLQFQSVNLRAEVFVNGKLVGYDVIGNTPLKWMLLRLQNSDRRTGLISGLRIRLEISPGMITF